MGDFDSVIEFAPLRPLVLFFAAVNTMVSQGGYFRSPISPQKLI